jgi:hypothetical protein
MSDNNDDNTSGNVINFGRRTGRTGFTLTPVPPTAGDDVTSPVIPPQPATPPTNGTGGRNGRRSPLDTLAALPSPTLTAPPVVATPHPDGGLPDTFRSPNSGDRVGPRMGALSMAAILAVAVAALRGSATVVEDWRQRRITRDAENAPLRKARIKAQAELEKAHSASSGLGSGSGSGGGKGGSGRGSGGKSKRVPSSHDFGRKTLGNRTGSGSKGPGSGAGSGSKGKGAGQGPGRGKSNNTGTGPGSKASRGGGLLGGGGRNKGGGSKTKDRSGTGSGSTSSKRQKSPRRGSQGAGSTLKKQKTPNGTGSGSGTKNTPSPKKQPKGRTTLRQAAAKQLGNAAQNRLHKRRNNLNNPALWSGKKTPNATKTKKKAPNPNGPSQSGSQTTTKPKKPTTKTPSGTKKRRAGRTTLAGAMGRTAYQAAKTRLKKRRHARTTPPIWSAARKSRTKTAPTTNTKKTPKTRRSGAAWAKQHARQAGSWTRRSWQRARTRAWKAATTNGGSFRFPGAGTSGGSAQQSTQNPGTSSSGAGPSTGRKSPFGNAASTGPTTWTVTRDDQPDPTGPVAGIGRGIDALPAAPEPHTARPSTTRPKEARPMPPVPVPAQDPRLQKARNQAARRGAAVAAQAGQMDAQHATEITLDDALDEYGDFKDDGFKTHAQSAKVSGQARKLRDTLAAFSEELAVSHNLIGLMFTGAMANLSESMDLVARMADEMEISSLEAAELAEAADNDLNDAYRPYTQATADAGLTTPSAPIHNKA